MLAETEIAAMESAIAADPESHPVVPGAGGVRKARWGRESKGKSGGVRIIYYYWLRDVEIYMLSIYAKNEQADMNAADKKAARKFVEALKNAEGKS